MKTPLSLTCLFLLSSLLCRPAFAVFGDGEPNFYAGGFPTAEVLRKGEWIVSGPISTWLAYGATSRLSIGVDYIQTLAEIPAGFFRYQLGEGPDHALYSIESYGVFFTKRYDDQRRDDYQVSHLGTQAWLHFSRTAFLSDRWHWHLYAGANYETYQLYEPYHGPEFAPTLYSHHVNPDFGTGVEYRGGPTWRLHLYALYGNTFEFEDYIAIKSQIAGVFQWSPFPARYPAFFRLMHLEFGFGFVDIPDGHYHKFPPFSILPVTSWRWGGKN